MVRLLCNLVGIKWEEQIRDGYGEERKGIAMKNS